MSALPGDEWVRDSPCCHAPMERDIGADDNGEVQAVLTCTCCRREYGDIGRPWTPVEVRTRVAVVMGRGER